MPESADDIFTIEKLNTGDGKVSASLIVNQSSSIFSGHFPDQPVVPGACMLQLVKDVLGKVLNANIVLKKAESIKFIHMITPVSSPAPHLLVTYKTSNHYDISVNAKITIGDVACFKLQATYTKV